MNPIARQEWCRRNGVEFPYPQQQQQPYYQQQLQHYDVPVQPPPYYQNYLEGQSEQQPLRYYQEVNKH